MQLNRNNLRLLNQLLDFWVGKGLLTEEHSTQLNGPIEEKKFGWQLLARYAFYCTMCSTFLSVFEVAIDDDLIALMLRLFDVPASTKAISMAVTGIFVFVVGHRLDSSRNLCFYSRESIYFVGDCFSCRIRLVFRKSG